MHAFLLEQYEKDKAKGRNPESQSEFPPIEQWQPSGQKLTSFEQTLLSGPSLTLHSIKRTRVKMSKTRKWIVYSAANDEVSLRIASSYVCTDISNDQPQFGRIIKLYIHTFGGCKSIISKIKLYQAAIYDVELSVWCVPQQDTDRTAFYFLDQISMPLIVSYDDENSSIWFLNYHMCL